MMSARRICIVGLDSYGMLSGEENRRYIGGESIQHVLLARAWRDLGHDVSMIVHDEGQGARRVHRRHHRHRGAYAPGRHPGPAVLPSARHAAVLSALIAADADIYYQSPAGAYTGITALVLPRAPGGDSSSASPPTAIAKRNMAASSSGAIASSTTTDCDAPNLVAAQTEFQAQLLRENHGLESSRRQHDGRSRRAAAPQAAKGHRRAVGQQSARAQASRAARSSSRASCRRSSSRWRADRCRAARLTTKT